MGPFFSVSTGDIIGICNVPLTEMVVSFLLYSKETFIPKRFYLHIGTTKNVWVG